jgi:hypothetical protein
MRQGINHFAAAMGATALILSGITVGVGARSYSDGITSVSNAGISLTRDPHSTRAASESFAPPAKAAPPCGFAATGSC